MECTAGKQSRLTNASLP